MKFSETERETLSGPAAVGVVTGIFVAVCIVAFASEYKVPASSAWSTIRDAMLGFFAGFLLAFVPFGLAPVLIARLRTGSGNKGRCTSSSNSSVERN